MIGIIIQARTGSTRFPRKIYEDINGKSTLYRVLEGVKRTEVPHKIILAMPEYDEEEFKEKLIKGEFEGAIDHRFRSNFGSADDVLDRYFQTARARDIDLIVRVTADCPLIQGNIIDEMLIEYLKNGYNGFMGNNANICSTPYPDGCDAEIFPYWMLAETAQLTNDPIDREHVCPFMYRRGTAYSLYEFKNCRPNMPISMRFPDFSFDTAEDLKIIKAIAKKYDTLGNLNQAIREAEVIDG